MLLMSSHYLQNELSGILQNKPIAQMEGYRMLFRLHILTGIIAISLGPLQFLSSLLHRYPRLHKGLGYLYGISVFLSSLSGLVVAQYAMGGMPTRIGFSLLAVCWLVSLLIAITYAQKGKISLHRNWMYLNYALTFAAITQRTLLLLAFIPGIPFMPVYQLSSWLPWMLNLGIAGYLIKRKSLYAKDL